MWVLALLFLFCFVFIIYVALSLSDERAKKAHEEAGKVNRYDFTPSNNDIYTDMMNELSALKAQNREWKAHFDILMGYQNDGMRYEKEGFLETAAFYYEKAISYGRSHMKINNYLHSIERLVIVYRKLKRYDDEIRTIENALYENLMPVQSQKFQERLMRAKQLRDNNNTKK